MMESNHDQSPQKIESPVEQTKTEAKKIKHEATQAIKGTVAKARQDMNQRAEEAKENLAGEVSIVASALRNAAAEMRNGSLQEKAFGHMASGLADASEFVKDKDLGQLAGSLKKFAKSNPLAFIGGAVALGFAASRFMKASEPGEPSGAASQTDALSHRET